MPHLFEALIFLKMNSDLWIDDLPMVVKAVRVAQISSSHLQQHMEEDDAQAAALAAAGEGEEEH